MPLGTTCQNFVLAQWLIHVAGGPTNITLSEIVSGGGTVAQSLVVTAFKFVGPSGVVLMLQLLGMVLGSTLGSFTG